MGLCDIRKHRSAITHRFLVQMNISSAIKQPLSSGIMTSIWAFSLPQPPPTTLSQWLHLFQKYIWRFMFAKANSPSFIVSIVKAFLRLVISLSPATENAQWYQQSSLLVHDEQWAISADSRRSPHSCPQTLESKEVTINRNASFGLCVAAWGTH